MTSILKVDTIQDQDGNNIISENANTITIGASGDGTAKVQADDIIRASTFAKVLSNTVIETYEDGSFIVPCSLTC
jgi:hypothetical protein